MRSDDDDLRRRFQDLAREESASTPPLSIEWIARRRATALAGERGWHSPRTLATIGAAMASVAVALIVGIVVGTNTGYASANVEREQQRHALVTSSFEIANQLAELGRELQRTRATLARRGEDAGAAPRASFVAADSELRRMEATLRQIQTDLTRTRAAVDTAAIKSRSGIPMKRALAMTCGALTLCSPTSPAQRPAETVPIVELPAPSARSAENFGAIVGVRELPGGKLLVDDGLRRQVLLLDATLGGSHVVLDSVRGASNFYGGRDLPLLSYAGDSSLFPNLASQTLLVLGPEGGVVRSTALPPGPILATIRRGAGDPSGRLIIQGLPAVRRSAPGGVPPAAADSSPILRIDFAQRRTDTVAFISRPLVRTDAIAASGIVTSVWKPDPLRMIDEWTLLSDGTVAVVRGHDYRVDWIRPDGSRTTSDKLPFDWRQTTDADRRQLIDSAQAQIAAAARNNTLLLNPDLQLGWRPAPGDAPAGSERIQTDVDSAGALYTNSATARLQVLPSDKPVPEHVFDYYPPVRFGAALADFDNRLWILPSTSKQSKAGELVYDVVKNGGGLMQRVRLPAGRYVVGFGRGGVVYLASGNLTTGFAIERSRLP